MIRSRVVYVITDLHTGGVPLHLARLVRGIRGHGFDPHVISLAPMGVVGQRLAADGFEVESCEAGGAWDVGVIGRLAARLRQLRPDLVHSYLFHANVASRFAVLLSGGSGRRLICEIQTVEIERRWHLWVGGLTQGLSGCVVGNSPSVVEHLHRRAHLSRDRLRCVPGGVDVERIGRAVVGDRVALGVGADERIVLWVGRLDPVKGLDELIDAFAMMGERARARLLLAGDGDYEGAVRARIAARGVGDRVLLLGRRTDIPELLKLADVFTLPSYTEGMPNALLEAMAAERGVVATDVAGCHDVVTHERTGLLVPPRDARALAAGLERLLNDVALREALGRAAGDHVRAAYSLDRCVGRYATLYREVLR